MPFSRRTRFEIASFGELASDPSRVAMLLALMEGRARPAGELARIAQVSASTASEHLQKLQQGGLLTVTKEGRHRYFAIANEEVAGAIEALALLRPHAAKVEPPIAYARTCYSHLAGRIGVAFRAALEDKGLLSTRDGAPALTARGSKLFEELGLSVVNFPEGKACLDWTERRHHLGGALGGLLTRHLFQLGWLARIPKARAVRITARGAREMRSRFGLAV